MTIPSPVNPSFELASLFSSERLLNFLQALLIVLAGLVIARLVSTGLARLMRGRPEGHVRILRRLAFFVVTTLFIASALHQLGFKLGLLFGAAGVLTVALGFASQTSASNLISGLFLLIEQPFSVGDSIRVGTTSGEVVSIDLLSAKIRTFENTFVRIPNESLIKTEVTTLTKYPIRRIDLKIPVSYSADLETTRKVLKQVAQEHPFALEEPEPIFFCLGFLDSAIELQYSVWAATENFVKARTELYEQIRDELAREGIEIPFPQRTVHLRSPPDDSVPSA